MPNMNIYVASGCLSAAILVLLMLGGYVWWQRRSAFDNRYFACMCVAVSAWFAALIVFLVTQNESVAYTAAHLFNILSATSLVFFFAGFAFVYQSPRIPWRVLTLLFVWGVLLPVWMALTDNMLSVDVTNHGTGRMVYTPVFQLILAVYVVMLLVIMLWNLVTKMRTLTGLPQKQVGYLFAGTFCMLVVVVLSDVIIPIWFLSRGQSLSLWVPVGGNLLGCFAFILCAAVAVVRYKAFEVSTIVHRTVGWLTASALLFVPFLGLGYQLLGLRGWMLLSYAILAHVFVYYYLQTRPLLDRLFQKRRCNLQAELWSLEQKFSQTLDVDLMVRTLLLHLEELLRFEHCFVILESSKGSSLDYVAHTWQGGEGRVLDLRNLFAFFMYLSRNKEALEREVVAVDDAYITVRKEFMELVRVTEVDVVVPVCVEDRLVGVLGLGKKCGRQRYKRDEIVFLERLSRHVGVYLYNALHHGDILEKKRLEYEMALGREIQSRLFPYRGAQTTPEYQIIGKSYPAMEIGGDYYDFLELGKDTLGVVIGDVSGKGVGAGIVMAMVKSVLHTLRLYTLSPRKIVASINQLLYHFVEANRFVTLLYLELDMVTHTVLYTGAGHEPMLVYRAATDTVEEWLSGGMVLGVEKDIDGFLQEQSLTLAAGDCLVLYTDGVIDTRDLQGNLYGLARFKQLVREVCRRKRARDSLLWDYELTQPLNDYRLGAQQIDDVTYVVIRRLGDEQA